MRRMPWPLAFSVITGLPGLAGLTSAAPQGSGAQLTTPRRAPASDGSGDVAGDYSRWWGGGRERLTLTAAGEFENVFGGCTGTSGWVGKYRVDGADLVLLPDYLRCWHDPIGRPREYRGPAVKLAPSHFRVVRWSARTNLVPQNQLGRFCRDIVAGEEPAHGPSEYFRRTTNSGAEVRGFPNLPAPWLEYLRAHPVAPPTPAPKVGPQPIQAPRLEVPAQSTLSELACWRRR